MKRRLLLGTGLFVFWIGLTQSTYWVDLLMGLMVCIISMILSSRLSCVSEHFYPAINKKFFTYIIAVIPAVFIAGAKSIYMIVTQKTEIKIIEVHTELENNFLVFILAMSITLSPGTITIHRDGNTLYVLRLYPLSSDPKEESNMIKSPFEKILMEE